MHTMRNIFKIFDYSMPSFLKFSMLRYVNIMSVLGRCHVVNEFTSALKRIPISFYRNSVESQWTSKEEVLACRAGLTLTSLSRRFC